jgi:hypothetical protein
VHATLDALAIALCVQIDDFLPARSGAERPPRISDSELITLAVWQMLLGLPTIGSSSRSRATASGTCSPTVAARGGFAAARVRRVTQRLRRRSARWAVTCLGMSARRQPSSRESSIRRRRSERRARIMQSV